MNFLKRLYLLLLTAALIVVVVVVLLAPGSISSWASSIMEAPVLLRVLVTLVIGLVLGALTFMQIRGERRNRMTGLMMRAVGAITEVNVDSARDRILKAVSDLPDVVSAEAQIRPVRGRADIEMQVTVFGHDVQLPAKQKEINRALNQVLNKQLGLRMAGRPRVHLQIYGEQPKPAPIAPPTSAQPENGSLVSGLFSALRRESSASEASAPAVEMPSVPPAKVIEPAPQAAQAHELERVGGLLGVGWRKTSAQETPAPVAGPADLESDDVKLDDFQPIKLDSELANSPTSGFMGSEGGDTVDDIDEELGIKRSVRDVGDMPDEDEAELRKPDEPAKD